jgi:hypothetical protein
MYNLIQRLKTIEQWLKIIYIQFKSQSCIRSYKDPSYITSRLIHINPSKNRLRSPKIENANIVLQHLNFLWKWNFTNIIILVNFEKIWLVLNSSYPFF